MVNSKRTTLYRSVLAVVFLGLLALPIYLENSSAEPDSSIPELDTISALNQFGFYLQEVSESAGISFAHKTPRLDEAFDHILPQIASMGASVSITDFDRDGWQDIYVTNSRYGSKNVLYRNLGDGSFEDVAGELGLASLNQKGTGVSMGAVWADLDNDGYEDLFLYKWGKPMLFRNDDGEGFTDITANSGLPQWINANTAIWFDYNSDGYVDLFIGGYFPEELDLWNLPHTAVLTESFEYSQNGGRNYLLKNRGNGTFQDVTSETGLSSTRWTLAAGAMDMDLDGFPELIIANDYGVDEFYQNMGGERFQEQGSDAIIGFSPKSGMNVSFGDTYNNGQPGIYISNITEEGVLLQGNNLWVPRSGESGLTFHNVARQSGIESGGWSYGAQFGDLNNDGSQDLYVANGFISAQMGTNYWYDYSKVTGGNKSIISDVRNWPPMQGRSQSGYQKNRIWLNTGTGFYYDVANYVAPDHTYDSRGVALADLWNRGSQDIIVANQGSGILLYKNHVDPNRNWIAFEVEGSKSNRSAIGATVQLFWEAGIQSQTVTGGIGFSSQNQRRIHFGLGDATAVDSAAVIWPDGIRQIIEQPAIRKVHAITENPS